MPINVSPRSHEVREENTKIVFDNISKEVVDIAFKIHQAMGPGLLEGIYEECFAISLKKRGLNFERQKEIPVFFETANIEQGLLINFGEPYFKKAIKRFVLSSRTS